MKKHLSSAEQLILDKNHSGRYRCPQCADGRKKKNPTLAVDFMGDHVLYDCHHCGFAGRINLETGYTPDPRTESLRQYISKKRHQEKVTPIPTKLNQDNSLLGAFFSNRGIQIQNVPDLGLSLTTTEKYFPDLSEKTMAVGFVYGDINEPEAIKWRPADGRKAFTQDGSAKSFYGIDKLGENEKEIIIVEGEADVVALAAHGITAISVPNGAPLKVRPDRRIDPEEDGKFAYVWQARDIINQAERIIVASDADGPGDALAEELARRTSRARCWRVQYPEGCKDPTDVLVKHGEAVMRDLLKNAQPFPLQGVYAAKDYSAEVWQLYEDGVASGETTGFANVDKLFTVKEGMLYVVTGFPGHGKSEFLDMLAINLSLGSGWKWAVASFENPPATHQVKMAEKIVGKPFFKGLNPRMNREEVRHAQEFINDHFVFLENKSGLATIESIMSRVEMAIQRLSVRGVIIDPYNYIDLGGDNEHQSITKMLSELGAFARANGVAIFFVAHPAKIAANQSGEMPIPKGHHISGSAAWFAKTDVGFTVHRGDMGVEIHCWKSRFKWLGSPGDTVLGYDVVTGRYFEPDKAKKVQEWGRKETWEVDW